MFKLKRIYESPTPKDGFRVLVDRLWPRGISKKQAALDAWMKDVAPSPVLRKWFGHDPAKWKEFQKRYLKELNERGEPVIELKERGKRGKVTLVYAAHDEEHTHAMVLKNYLERPLK